MGFLVRWPMQPVSVAFFWSGRCSGCKAYFAVTQSRCSCRRQDLDSVLHSPASPLLWFLSAGKCNTLQRVLCVISFSPCASCFIISYRFLGIVSHFEICTFNYLCVIIHLEATKTHVEYFVKIYREDSR